mgnify:CR=1 FL=1
MFGVIYKIIGRSEDGEEEFVSVYIFRVKDKERRVDEGRVDGEEQNNGKEVIVWVTIVDTKFEDIEIEFNADEMLDELRVELYITRIAVNLILYEGKIS